jgi:hypothetical protein
MAGTQFEQRARRGHLVNGMAIATLVSLAAGQAVRSDTPR